MRNTTYDIGGLLWLATLLLLVSPFVQGQYAPSLNLAQFTNDTSLRHRQDVCDRFQQYDRGEVELRNALKGLELHSIVIEGPFFNLDENGNLDEANSGMQAVLLDELASRAGFTWRNTYAFTDKLPPGSDKTYTDLLFWGIDYYDVFVGRFAKTLARLNTGVSFPQGYYDRSYILVGLAEESKDPAIDLWQWLEPFDPEVWYCIAVTIVVSGVLYQILDHIPKDRHKRRHKPKPTFNEYRREKRLSNASSVASDDRQYTNAEDIYEGAHTMGDGIFLSSLLFTQHFQFMPRTPSSRLFSASMGLWALLISSNYTANLASFFVIENTPSLSINSIDDAISAGYPICVWAGSASAEFAKAAYPQAKYVDTLSEEETIRAILNGECPVGISAVATFELLRDQKEYNPDCNLVWVGRVLKHVPSGFGVKSDAGSFCSSLISDVLNLHLVEMEADGFTQEAWNDHLSKVQDQNCDAVTEPAEEANLSRSLKEMAGTFVLHFFFGIAAIILMVVNRIYDKFRVMSADSRKEFLASTRASAFAGGRRQKQAMETLPGAVPESESEIVIPPTNMITNEVDCDESRRNVHFEDAPAGGLEDKVGILCRRQDEMEQKMGQKLDTLLQLLTKQQQQLEELQAEKTKWA